MEKMMIRKEENLNTYLSFDEIIKEMNIFKREHPNGTDFNVEATSFQEYDYTYSQLFLICYEWETDDEFEERCKREEYNTQQSLERKRVEFERLKKELGEV